MTAAPEIPADVMAAASEVPGIPNDIWTAASTVATSTLGFGVNRSALLIARAILAERQRCVTLADAEVEGFRHHDAPQAAFGALTVRRAIQGP